MTGPAVVGDGGPPRGRPKPRSPSPKGAPLIVTADVRPRRGGRARNLYATAPGAFIDAEHIGEMFARQAGIALANATAFDRTAPSAADPSVALEHSDVIGQPRASFRAQHRIRPEAAFTLLRQAAQRSKAKSYDVARQLVEHHLPLGDRRP